MRKVIIFLLGIAYVFPNISYALDIPAELPFGGNVESVIFCDCSFTFRITYSPLFLGSIPAGTGKNKITALVYSPFTTKLYDWGKSIRVPILGINLLFDPTVLIPGAWHLGKYSPAGAAACVTGAPFCSIVPSIGVITYMGSSKGSGKPSSFGGSGSTSGGGGGKSF